MSKYRSALLFGAVSLVLNGMVHDNAWGSMDGITQNTTEPQEMKIQPTSQTLEQLQDDLLNLMAELSEIKDIRLKNTVDSFRAEGTYVQSLLSELQKLKNMSNGHDDELTQPLKHLLKAATDRRAVLETLKPNIQKSLTTIKTEMRTFNTIEDLLRRRITTVPETDRAQLEQTAEYWKSLKSSALTTINDSCKIIDQKLSDTVARLVSDDLNARWDAAEKQLKDSLRTIESNCDDFDKQSNERFKTIVDSWRSENRTNHEDSMGSLEKAKRDFLADVRSLTPNNVRYILINYFSGVERCQRQAQEYTQISQQILITKICLHLLAQQLGLAEKSRDLQVIELMLAPQTEYQYMHVVAQNRNPLLLRLLDAVSDLLPSKNDTNGSHVPAIVANLRDIQNHIITSLIHYSPDAGGELETTGWRLMGNADVFCRCVKNSDGTKNYTFYRVERNVQNNPI